jgi:hypothetical protein
MSAQHLTGVCHCGGVAFTLPADSTGVLACHCEDCRKMHGNYNAMIAVPASDVTFTARATLTWYQSSPTARRAFCGTCGARVLKDIPAAGRYLISAGLIDGATGMHILKNLWETSKGDWYDLPVAAPQTQL